MAGSPFLGVSIYSGTPTLQLYNSPSAISLGSTFGVADTIVDFSNQPINRAVYFSANNINNPSGSAGAIYASVGTGIYRSLDGGNSWAQALAIYNIGGGGVGTGCKSGLNIVTGSDGTQYLCFIYMHYDGTHVHAGYRTTDGYTWTYFSNNSVRQIENTGFRQDTVVGGILYCLAGSTVTCFNPATGEFTWVAAGNANSQTTMQSSMCVWDNVIYVVRYVGTSRLLYRLDVGLTNSVATLVTGVGSTATNVHKMAMFVDASALYVFVLLNASSNGWGCFQVDQALGAGQYTVTDITSTVIPSGMSGAGPGTSSRALAYVDGNASPGANPTKYLLYAANGTNGTAWELFQWNGANARMTSGGSGGNVGDGITVSKQSSSNGVYSPFGVYPYIISSGPADAGWRINFTLWGSPPGTTTSLRLWYGGANDEYLIFVGTLANPSSGTLGANNTSVTGLAVDSGLSLYSITWVPPSSISDNKLRFSFVLEPF